MAKGLTTSLVGRKVVPAPGLLRLWPRKETEAIRNKSEHLLEMDGQLL